MAIDFDSVINHPRYTELDIADRKKVIKHWARTTLAPSADWKGLKPEEKFQVIRHLEKKGGVHKDTNVPEVGKFGETVGAFSDAVVGKREFDGSNVGPLGEAVKSQLGIRNQQPPASPKAPTGPPEQLPFEVPEVAKQFTNDVSTYAEDYQGGEFKHNFPQQADNLPPGEAPIEPSVGALYNKPEGYLTQPFKAGLTESLVAKAAGAEHTKFAPADRLQREIMSGATMFGDTPGFLLGLALGGGPNPVGFATSFAFVEGLHAAVDTRDKPLGTRILAAQTAIARGATTGYAFGRASRTGGAIAKFAKEVGVTAAVSAGVKGELPTVDEVFDTAILFGVAHGTGAAFNLIGEINNISPKVVEAKLKDVAEKTGKPLEEVVNDAAKVAVEAGINDVLDVFNNANRAVGVDNKSRADVVELHPKKPTAKFKAGDSVIAKPVNILGEEILGISEANMDFAEGFFSSKRMANKATDRAIKKLETKIEKEFGKEGRDRFREAFIFQNPQNMEPAERIYAAHLALEHMTRRTEKVATVKQAEEPSLPTDKESTYKRSDLTESIETKRNKAQGELLAHDLKIRYDGEALGGYQFTIDSDVFGIKPGATFTVRELTRDAIEKVRDEKIDSFKKAEPVVDSIAEPKQLQKEINVAEDNTRALMGLDAKFDEAGVPIDSTAKKAVSKRKQAELSPEQARENPNFGIGDKVKPGDAYMHEGSPVVIAGKGKKGALVYDLVGENLEAREIPFKELRLMRGEEINKYLTPEAEPVTGGEKIDREAQSSSEDLIKQIQEATFEEPKATKPKRAPRKKKETFREKKQRKAARLKLREQHKELYKSFYNEKTKERVRDIDGVDAIELKRISDKVQSEGAGSLTEAEMQTLKRMNKAREVEAPSEEELKKRYDEGEHTNELIDMDKFDEAGYDPNQLNSGLGGLGQSYKHLQSLIESVVSKEQVMRIVKGGLRAPFHTRHITAVSKYLANMERKSNRWTNRAKKEIRSVMAAPDAFKAEVAELHIMIDGKNGILSKPELRDLRVASRRDGVNYDNLRYEAIKERLLKFGANEKVVDGWITVQRALDLLQKQMMRKLLRENFMQITDGALLAKLDITKEAFNALSPEQKANMKSAHVYKQVEKFIDIHYLEGYYPHRRFGDFIARGKDQDGNKISSGFNTEKEAIDFAATLIDGTMFNVNDKVPNFKELASVLQYKPLFEKYAEQVGMDKTDMDAVISLMARSRAKTFAGGHTAKRAGVKGYSKEWEKVINEYIDTYPFAMHKVLGEAKLRSMVKKVPEHDGLRVYANELGDYFYGRINPEGPVNRFVRTAAYVFYLTAKPAFGFVNLTQRVTMTLPWAMSEFGELAGPKHWAAAQAMEGKLMVRAVKLIGNRAKTPRGIAKLEKEPSWGIRAAIKESKDLDRETKLVLLELYARGDLSPTRSNEIGYKHAVWATLDFVGRTSEKSNRIQAALLAVRGYKAQGIRGKKLLARVEDFIDNTQILYSKANRPKVGRGGLAMPFLFKNFPINYISLQAKLFGQNKAAFATSMAIAWTLGGLTKQVPDVALEAIDYYMEHIQKNYLWGLQKREMAKKVREKGWLNVMLNGPSSLLELGIPEMFSITGGMTSIALWPIIKGVYYGGKNLGREDMTLFKKWKGVYPSEAKKLYTAIELAKNGGIPVNQFGKPRITEEDYRALPKEIRARAIKVYESTPNRVATLEQILIGLGFPSATLNQYYADIYGIGGTARLLNEKKQEMSRAIGKIVAEEKVTGVRNPLIDEKINRAEEQNISPSADSLGRNARGYYELFRNQ